MKKKPIWKSYLVYVSHCVTIQKRQNNGSNLKNQFSLQVREAGWLGKHRGCLGQWNSPVKCYTGGYQPLYILSTLMEHTMSRVNPNINHGLRVAMMCQCRFMDCNKWKNCIEIKVTYSYILYKVFYFSHRSLWYHKML